MYVCMCVCVYVYVIVTFPRWNIPQTEQHSPFGLMLLHLGNVTIMCVCVRVCVCVHVSVLVYTPVEAMVYACANRNFAAGENILLGDQNFSKLNFPGLHSVNETGT